MIRGVAAQGLLAILLLVACQSRSTVGARSADGQRSTTGRSGTPSTPSAPSSTDGDPAVLAGSATAAVQADYDEETDALGDEPDDDEPALPSAVAGSRTVPHPLDELSAVELEQALKAAPESLGSVSLGRPNAGSLFNGVRMPENEAWKLVSPNQAYGTEETVRALVHALRRVYERSPATPVVSIGHLSAKEGGFLRPHRSHQAGRDVDISFYYRDAPNRWYARATPNNLDLERTLYLIQVLVNETDIEMILIDQSLHAPLKQYALEQGLEAAWVEGLFRNTQGRPPIVRHAPGHATHLHLRFKNPVARKSGERLASLLSKHQLVRVPPKTVTHVARAGDTLAKLAARYGTTMRAIRLQNGLRNTQLVAGHRYEIPVAHPPASPSRKNSSASKAATTSRK